MKEAEIFPITPDQARLAKQFEHALQSFYYARDIVHEQGADGIVFDTNIDGERTELCIDRNMMRGLQTAVGARFKDLKSSGGMGKKIATDIVQHLQSSHEQA